MHFTISRSLPGSRTISEDEICALIEMLLRLGTDIEYQNTDGLTHYFTTPQFEDGMVT